MMKNVIYGVVGLFYIFYYADIHLLEVIFQNIIIKFISNIKYMYNIGRSEEEILKKVKLGKVKFDPEDWDKMSNESKTLIRKMLTLDPKKRMSAE